MSNGSTEEPIWEFGTHTLSLVLNCVIFVLGTVGNGLIIYVAGFRMKRSVNTVWFLNLAVADFFFTTFLIFIVLEDASQDHHWPFGRVMCKLSTFSIVINMFASVLTLLAISVDRCLVTTMAVWAQNKRTVLKAKLVCLVIWIIALSCSIPRAAFIDTYENQSITYCEYDLTDENFVILTLFDFIVGFLIPFVGITISHVVIYCRVRRLQTTRNRRPRRIIIAVILAFFFCWLPYHTVDLYLMYCENPEIYAYTERIAYPLTTSLAFLNSCLNPILYVFMCKDFQKKLKQSICLVLESALTEEQQSRSGTAHFTRINQKSESTVPTDNTDTVCPEVKGEVHLEDNDTHLNND